MKGVDISAIGVVTTIEKHFRTWSHFIPRLQQ